MDKWHRYWHDIRVRIEADPELERLRIRRDAVPFDSPAYRRRDTAYRARHGIVEEQAHLDQAAADVDQERSDKAAYMRDYRAAKRAIREAVDARRAAAADGCQSRVAGAPD